MRIVIMPFFNQSKKNHHEIKSKFLLGQVPAHLGNYRNEPTLKSKACLKCLYFTKIISALCCYLEYFSYLYTIN